MRRLKKTARATLTFGCLTIFSVFTIANASSNKDVEPTIAVEEFKLSTLEKLELNESIESEYKELGVDYINAFFLYKNNSGYTFMSVDENKKIYVNSKIVEESYADTLRAGDNALLFVRGNAVIAVGVEAGKSVTIEMATLESVSERGNVYELENGEVVTVDKQSVSDYGLEKSTVGTLSTAYMFENKIVTMEKGW